MSVTIETLKCNPLADLHPTRRFKVQYARYHTCVHCQHLTNAGTLVYMIPFDWAKDMLAWFLPKAVQYILPNHLTTIVSIFTAL